MTGEVLTIEHDGGIATITLNRPEAMNALSSGLRRALIDALVALDNDDSVRAIILTGAGERAFCAGLDLKEMGGEGGGTQAMRASGNPVRAIEECRKPVIGAINGVAITGGFEIALACDILIASAKARFADTHARVGLLPGWGLSQKLSRLIGIYRARELSLTGNFLDARTAADWGLVNRVVEPDELLPTAQALATDMAKADPAMLAAIKQLIGEGYALPFGEAMALESRRSAAHNDAVSSQRIEARRAAVLEQGRAGQK